MAEKQHKRKKYVIDRSFQYRFIASFLLWIFVSLLVFSAGFTAFYWFRYMAGENVFSEFITIQKAERIYNEKGEPTGTKSVVQPPINRIELILPPILVNNLIIVVLLVIIGIFYSHRIAGPVYRISRDIERVLEGEKGVSIRLRKKDKLKDLAEKINQLIAKGENS